jgi:hypothetical protein
MEDLVISHGKAVMNIDNNEANYWDWDQTFEDAKAPYWYWPGVGHLKHNEDDAGNDQAMRNRARRGR